MKTLVKNLLKSFVIVAAMAYMAIVNPVFILLFTPFFNWQCTGTAMAQNWVSESCDTNMGAYCLGGVNYSIDDAGGPPAGGAVLFCNQKDHECTYPWDSGVGQESIPNFQSCATSESQYESTPWSQTCASGYCFLGVTSPYYNYPIDPYNTQPTWDGGFYCCAAPGQTVAWGSYFTCNPYINWAVTPYLNNFAFGDPFFHQFDAGTNPLGGSMRAMKTWGPASTNWVPVMGSVTNPDPTNVPFSNPISEPLGFFWPANLPPSQTHYLPNYVCQPQFYNWDGGWLLEDVNNNGVYQDLMECGGFPDDILGSGYFPCCGAEYDGGKGFADLCKPEYTQGVQNNHCACIHDGQHCDHPRLLDATTYDGYNGVEGAGECCTPGMNTQYHVGPTGAQVDGMGHTVLAGNQGWCRPADGVNPYDAGGTSSTVPGYCNCLPLNVATCTANADCCGYSAGNEVCGSLIGDQNGCCAPSEGACTTTADCCNPSGETILDCAFGKCQTCKPDGGSCTSGSGCCYNSPQISGYCGGLDTCGCNFDGGPCNTDTDCCDSIICNHTDGICGCSEFEGACFYDSDCCSDYPDCNRAYNTCGCSGPEGYTLHDECVTDADCCPGLDLACIGGFCTP